jgi:hypothetical protein
LWSPLSLPPSLPPSPSFPNHNPPALSKVVMASSNVSFYALVCMLILSANGGVRMCHGCSGTQCSSFYTACTAAALTGPYSSDCCSTGIDCSKYTCPGQDCTFRLVSDLKTTCNNCMINNGVNDIRQACFQGASAASLSCIKNWAMEQNLDSISQASLNQI